MIIIIIIQSIEYSQYFYVYISRKQVHCSKYHPRCTDRHTRKFRKMARIEFRRRPFQCSTWGGRSAGFVRRHLLQGILLERYTIIILFLLFIFFAPAETYYCHRWTRQASRILSIRCRTKGTTWTCTSSRGGNCDRYSVDPTSRRSSSKVGICHFVRTPRRYNSAVCIWSTQWLRSPRRPLVWLSIWACYSNLQDVTPASTWIFNGELKCTKKKTLTRTIVEAFGRPRRRPVRLCVRQGL